MQTESKTSETGQDSTPENNRVDLTAIAAAHPVNRRVAVLDLNTFDATQLTVLEVLDMADACSTEPDKLADLLASKQQTGARMRLMFAMAWCIARRADKSLTFDEVCTWKLEIIGEVKPEVAEKTAKRAAILVGAAQASGLSPEEAGNLSIAELSQYQQRNRAARRTRKRAG